MGVAETHHGTSLLEIINQFDGGAFAHFGGDVEGVGVVLDVGEAHTGAETHLADLLRSGGVTFLHGAVDVGDAGTLVGKHDLDVVLFQVDGDVATIGVGHDVDLSLIQRDDRLLHNFGTDPDFLEHALHLAGCGSRVGEIAAFYVVNKVHNVRFG